MSIWHAFDLHVFNYLQDFIGRIECTLGEIVGAMGGRTEKPLQLVILSILVINTCLSVYIPVPKLICHSKFPKIVQSEKSIYIYDVLKQ